MKRFILLIFSVFLLLAPASAEAAKWFKTVAEAQKEAQKKNALIFVDLFAQWCGWCHRFEAEIVPSEVFQNATKDMVMLKVDTEDRGEGTKLSAKYGVSKLPTFLILTPDMNLAGVISGYAPAPQFVARLNEVVASYKNFSADVANEAKYSANYAKRLELAKGFLERQIWSEGEKRLGALAAEKNAPWKIRSEAWYHLALSQLAQKKSSEALATMKKFAAIDAAKRGAFAEQGALLLAQIHVEQKNYKAAIEEYRKFQSAFPNSPNAEAVGLYLPQLERLASNQ